MLVLADVTTWLEALGITVPILDGAWIPPDPDRIVLVSLAGGPGMLYERAYDRQAVTLRTRGAQRVPSDAEALAAEVDDAVLSVIPPVAVGAGHVNDIDRVSPPRFVAMDKAFRNEFSATYLFTVARPLP